jgi:hypothetical protein
MSTDFIALFDVRVDAVTPEWLLARLEERPEVFAPFAGRYGQVFGPRNWAVERGFVQPSEPMLVGPGGFVLRRHAHTLELWHGIRFSMFSGDGWHRDVLRGICRVVAGLVGSPRAIYTHELMPYGDDDGLARIEAGLRERIGPPANTFEELHAAEYFGPRAWYIESFAE